MWTNIVVAVSSVVVALAALSGFSTWRKEMTGKAKFDAARNISFLARKVNQDFKRARYPLSSYVEAVSRPKREDESPRETQVFDQWYIRSHRIEVLREDLMRLEEAAWVAEIVLGERVSKSITEALDMYNKSLGEIASSINSYFEIKLEQAQGNTNNVYHESIKQLRQTINSTDGDDLSRRLEDVTNHLNSCLRNYLR